MYVIYVNNVCLKGPNGTNDAEIKCVTSNLKTAITVAKQIVEKYRQDEDAYVDEEWEEWNDECSCIIFWGKQNNWSWYSEICIKEVEEMD